MQAPPVLALVALMGFGSATASANGRAVHPLPWTHIRAASPLSRALVVESARMSSIVKDLLDSVERSDVIVHLVVTPKSIDEAPAFLSFLTSAGGWRHVLVKVDWQFLGRRAIAMLGHELQHALEIVAAPETVDQQSFLALYKRIGFSVGSAKYETDAARDTGHRIEYEMAGMSPRTWQVKPAARPRQP